MNDLEQLTLSDIIKLSEESRSLLYDITNWKLEGKPSELLSNLTEIERKVRAILENQDEK